MSSRRRTRWDVHTMRTRDIVLYLEITRRPLPREYVYARSHRIHVTGMAGQRRRRMGEPRLKRDVDQMSPIYQFSMLSHLPNRMSGMDKVTAAKNMDKRVSDPKLCVMTDRILSMP